jgi:transposase
MYIERVPNRNSPPCILLRQSRREGSKVKKKTVANLTHWPTDLVATLQAVLKGATVIENEDDFEIQRTLPHGHVAAALGVLQDIGLDRIIYSRRSAQRDLAIAMTIARIIDPRSKLATARGFSDETAFTSLGGLLQVQNADENDLYAAMDWLLTRQASIENALAKKHLKEGSLVLYDVSSSYFEGTTCPLAKRGHNRDKKKGKLQIIYGLLCNVDGCPIAIEVFEGNTGDPSTLGSQINKIRQRFGISHVIFVGDRGMITDARIRNDIKPIEGLDWISALRGPAIKKLIKNKCFEPSLFDDVDMAEVSSPDYPDERLIVCHNPILAEKRRRTRESLLAVTEKGLAGVVKAIDRTRKPLRGADEIGVSVGKLINKHKVGKHFKVTITDDSLQYERKPESISSEAVLDGFYIVRTSVSEKTLSAEQTVTAYKDLSHVEQAFRSIKTVDLKVRPIHHHLADRVRSHVFLCMLAYYVEWHMRQRLAPILFDDDDKQTAKDARRSPVEPAQQSAKAKTKAYKKRSYDNWPVHSFQTALMDLATIAKNRIQFKGNPSATFDKITQPTKNQQQMLELLKVKL